MGSMIAKRRANKQVHLWVTPETYRKLEALVKTHRRRSVPDLLRMLIHEAIDSEKAPRL